MKKVPCLDFAGQRCTTTFGQRLDLEGAGISLFELYAHARGAAHAHQHYIADRGCQRKVDVVAAERLVLILKWARHA